MDSPQDGSDTDMMMLEASESDDEDDSSTEPQFKRLRRARSQSEVINITQHDSHNEEMKEAIALHADPLGVDGPPYAAVVPETQANYDIALQSFLSSLNFGFT